MKVLANTFYILNNFTVNPGSFYQSNGGLTSYVDDSHSSFATFSAENETNEEGQRDYGSESSQDNFGGNSASFSNEFPYNTKTHLTQSLPEWETRDTVGYVPQTTELNSKTNSFYIESGFLKSKEVVTEFDGYYIGMLSNTESPVVTMDDEYIPFTVDWWNTNMAIGQVSQPALPYGLIELASPEIVVETFWQDSTDFFSVKSNWSNVFSNIFVSEGHDWNAAILPVSEGTNTDYSTHLGSPSYTFENIYTTYVASTFDTLVSGSIEQTTFSFLLSTSSNSDFNHSQEEISYGAYIPPPYVLATRTRNPVMFLARQIEVFTTYEEVVDNFVMTKMGTLKSSYVTTQLSDFMISYYDPYEFVDTGETIDHGEDASITIIAGFTKQGRTPDTTYFPGFVIHPAGSIRCFEPFCVNGFLPFGETNSSSPIYTTFLTSGITSEDQTQTFSFDFPGFYLVRGVKKCPDDLTFFTKSGFGRALWSESFLSTSSYSIEGPFDTEHPISTYEYELETYTYLDGLIGSAKESTAFLTSFYLTAGYSSYDFTDNYSVLATSGNVAQFGITRDFSNGRTFDMTANVSLFEPRYGSKRFYTNIGYGNWHTNIYEASFGGANNLEIIFGKTADKTLEIFYGNWEGTFFSGSNTTETNFRMLFEESNTKIRSTLTFGENQGYILSHVLTPRQMYFDTFTPDNGAGVDHNYALLELNRDFIWMVQPAIAARFLAMEMRWTTEHLGAER